MQLGQWGEFMLKIAILFAGVYVIILLTPKIASFIDKRRKPEDELSAPRPERVDDDESAENADENDNDL